jgi:hypothetical protein
MALLPQIVQTTSNTSRERYIVWTLRQAAQCLPSGHVQIEDYQGRSRSERMPLQRPKAVVEKVELRSEQACEQGVVRGVL